MGEVADIIETALNGIEATDVYEADRITSVLIALFGICVQNDIILVAKINDFRKQGLALREAVVEGALTKFRPIIMTDMVMIVAVLPMALIVSTGAELHRPLAVVYIGGFFFAILLRLIIVPLLYEVMCKAAEKKRA